MKIQLTLLLCTILSFTAIADTGTLENIDISTNLVGISFEDNNDTVVLRFDDVITVATNCIIEIEKIANLEYKTRVMRYFGGLLVSKSHNFKNLVVIIDGKTMHFDWSRSNVSTIVNKMCREAEILS